MSAFVISVAAFYIGQATAGPSLESAGAADPCAEIHDGFTRVTDDLGSDDPGLRLGAMAHYIVDHPACFSPQLVAQSKARLDMLARNAH